MVFDFPSTKISREIAKRYGYNEFVIRRWLNFFKDVERLVEAFERGVPKYIRVNTIKIDEKKLLERLEYRGFKLSKTEVPYCYEIVEEPYSIGATPEFLIGYYYVMDKSSCVSPLALDPKSNEIVLDLAASPGGKTTMLSMLMKNKGVVVAVEAKEERIGPLIDNVHRMGALNVAVVNMDGREIKKLGIEFDKVLLDAPCSGEGVIFKDSERKMTMCARDIEFCSSLQKELILAAFNVLKKDGVLVYSTCTLAPEENELVVDYLLAKRRAVLEEIQWGDEALNFGNPEIKKARRFYPHKHKTAGFFVAKIRKV